MPADDGTVDTRRWPEPRAGQVEVLLLGTVHMEWSRLDDVLDPERQCELRELTDRLEIWEPDGVAVERPYELQSDVDELYEEYQSGDRSYDEEFDTESSHPLADDTITVCRGESVQIGFRLADRLDHDQVHAVDSPMYMDAYLDEELGEGEFEKAKRAAASNLDVSIPEGVSETQVERWHESTVVGFLEWQNREENLRTTEASHSAVALAGFDERYRGARLLTGWYERNLRIVENLYRAADDHNLDRLLLVIGQGHTHILRHLLSDAPPLCPVNPRPVLTD